MYHHYGWKEKDSDACIVHLTFFSKRVTYSVRDFVSQKDLEITKLLLENGVLGWIQGVSHANNAVVSVTKGLAIGLGQDAGLGELLVHDLADTAVRTISTDQDTSDVGLVVRTVESDLVFVLHCGLHFRVEVDTLRRDKR